MKKIVNDLENYKNKLIEDKNEMKLKEQSEVLQVVEISYGEWYGTKKRPKLEFFECIGVKKGDWVWISVNRKKTLNGSHIKILNVLSIVPESDLDKINDIKRKLTIKPIKKIKRNKLNCSKNIHKVKMMGLNSRIYLE